MNSPSILTKCETVALQSSKCRNIMAIKVPQYRRFQNQYEFLTENAWEIKVPQSEHIEWAIVLSCLFSDSLYDKIKEFMGLEENVKGVVETFNPFINRFSFSQNSTLKNIVKEFRDKLQGSTCKETSTVEIDVKVMLKRVSEYLGCKIYLFSKDMKSFDLFSPDDTPPGVIILFKSEQGGEVENSFGLVESYCEKWRKDALKYILSKTAVKVQTFENIWQKVKCNENFLITILKSDIRNVIEDLSDSPLIIRKLHECGFQIDPTIKDQDERCGFYHALFRNNSDLCVSVYHFGIFCCTEDNSSTREPSRDVIHNLKVLKKTLLNDMEKLAGELESDNAQLLRSIYKKYLIFNSLISLKIKVSETILKALGETAAIYPGERNDGKFQIQKHRNIVISILDAYLENSKRFYRDNKHKLENYVDYKYYFDIIDVDVSLYFFDYIFKLKKKLILKDEHTYATAESSFFIFLLKYVVCNRKLKNSACFNTLCKISKSNTYEIPFMIREYHLGKIEFFYYVLKNTAVDDEVVRNEVPAKEFSLLLHEYEEIRNYFLIRRLTIYMKSGTNVIEETDCKILQVFIIQRVLQVIGEFMKKEPDDDFTVKWLLSLYFPKYVRKVFHDLRNELSHLNNHKFGIKINVEKDMNFFKGVQDDISNMYEYIQPFLNVMTEMIIIYIKEKLIAASNEMTASDNYRDVFQYNIKMIIEIILDIPVQFFQKKSFDDLIMVFENILKHLEEKLREKEDEFRKIKSKKMQDEEKIILSSMKKMFQPIKYLLNLLLYKFELLHQMYYKPHEEHYKTVKEFLSRFEICNNQRNLSNFINDSKLLITDCIRIISQVRTSQNINIIQLKPIQNTEIFCKILKTSTFLYYNDKEGIKQYFHTKLKDDFSRRENIKCHILEGFTMNEGDLENNRISYMLTEEWTIFLSHYKKKKKRKTLNSLERHDPLMKLEDIFKENSVKEKELELLCKRIPLPCDIRGKLGKFIKGTQKKTVGNRLSHLLNRIINLEKVLIGEENTAFDLWISENLFLEKHIFNRFVEDRHAKLATEMLIFDCMNLFKKKLDEWEKSSGLFQGIDLRNIIAHEDVVIQNICEWFDPSDLPSDIVRTVISFLKDKPIIVAILELYEKANNNFNEFLRLLESEGEKSGLVDKHNVILENIKKYVELLPYADKALCMS